MDTSNHHRRPAPLVTLGMAGILIIFTFGSIALGSNNSWAQNPEAKSGQEIMQFSPSTAQLQELRGKVEIQAQDGQWRTARQGNLLAAGERVRTGELSSVTLAFFDGSQSHLESNTEMSVQALNAQDSDQKRQIELYQWSGDSSHTVVKNNQQGSVYAVHSPNGTGEAKGTEFRVLVLPELKTLYYVLDGIVSVTSIQVTVLVNPGEYTIVLPEQPPSNPYPYVTVEGVVTQIGDTWMVEGLPYQVNENTIILGTIQVGDWIHVDAHLLDDGSRVADFILLLHSSPLNQFTLTGVVDAIGEQEWTVNSQTITITDTTTIEPGIITGNQVKVDGLIREDGSLLAVTIERQEPVPGLPFEFTGIVQTMDTSAWIISGITVGITTTTTIAPGLVEGDLVKVEGYIQPSGLWVAATIQHTTIEENQFDFTGILQNMNPWQVSGIGIETREWTVIDTGLQVGDTVHVTGEIDSSGVWIATAIEKVENQEPATIILIGTVFSINPWVVNGIPLNVTAETVIEGDIAVGMLVRVEISPQPDGSWIVLKIQPFQSLPEFIGCMDVVATVVSFDGSQIQLLNWPVLTLSPDVQISGDLASNTIIRMHVCFTQEAVIQITLIVVIGQVDPVEPPETEGKVFVCHKPDKKKGGHTLNIGAAALPAHLGHGDYQGPCR